MTIALDTLRSGGKRALAEALARVERAPHAPETTALLDSAFQDIRGLTVGITGPPGVGKSTLLDALIARLRAERMSVAVIAVDPSSVRTGGALLGDRARFASLDPLDPGVFVRSMATRGRLGGLSTLVFPAMMLMQATHDIVLVETVGVGQSEIEIAGLADATVLCVQPEAGDSLQFLKSGIMEVPDMILVTKSDIGAAARRAAADIRSALSVTEGSKLRSAIHLVSARNGNGLAETLATLLSYCDPSVSMDHRRMMRIRQSTRWNEDAVRESFGAFGLAKWRILCKTPCDRDVFESNAQAMSVLAKALEDLDFRGETISR